MDDNLKYPTFNATRNSGCGLRDWREDYKTDCYFFVEDIDMGARIPWCSYDHKIIQHSECDKCKNYIQKRTVYEMVCGVLEMRGGAQNGN